MKILTRRHGKGERRIKKSNHIMVSIVINDILCCIEESGVVREDREK
jgi:hypothetical protein